MYKITVLILLLLAEIELPTRFQYRTPTQPPAYSFGDVVKYKNHQSYYIVMSDAHWHKQGKCWVYLIIDKGLGNIFFAQFGNSEFVRITKFATENEMILVKKSIVPTGD